MRILDFFGYVLNNKDKILKPELILKLLLYPLHTILVNELIG